MSETGLSGAGAATYIGTAAIQFFGIELCPTTDGRLYVGIAATVCEEEGELSQVDLGDHRAVSLDDAFAFIRDTINLSH
jgi:hypothetical protein